ncbi:hypothetical protein PITC_036260 [Penicillium italicum]|uniref:Uncharacterized protein n=1 Tax=Penicillium italicum TaxID=40296 RepID=A0A0A2LGD9_PENIT|nr:hypothetical protein PITC_036260 [Penicillium italicum]
MWRDVIRAMFNCRALGLNIMNLTLNYNSGAEDESLFHDLTIEEWEDILRDRKFETEKIYECDMVSDATEEAMLASPGTFCDTTMYRYAPEIFPQVVDKRSGLVMF